MSTTETKALVSEIIDAQGKNRMDIFVRFLYAQMRLGTSKHTEEKIRSLYEKMQTRRLAQRFPNETAATQKKRVDTLDMFQICHEFESLIRSMKKNGFLSHEYNHYIMLGRKKTKCLIDGSHRLACCLALKIKEAPIKYYDTIGMRERKKYGISPIDKSELDTYSDYRISWFAKNDFTESEIKLIKDSYFEVASNNLETFT